MTGSLTERYQTVLDRIKRATEQAGRHAHSVQLLAVSKTKPIEAIEQIAQQGQTAFGENYVQEALQKIAQHPDLEWHFIGPIQSNKTKPIAEHFQWVHSVDRLKIAQRLSAQRPESLGPLNILLEVNVSNEPSKSGFTEEELFAAAHEIAHLPNLKLRGLMAIPQIATQFEEQRKPFAQMRRLLSQLQNQLPDCQIDTLSMGMSGDLEAAIMEGATMVRIGTDIFGQREKR
ncbi:YggS family pyridoxal phosphate-dependent enzyme [Thiomicrorhabdus sp. zzn3]|uniref:YggS family pyridoxal phosphate-dependent enzyme n=1 Tax=Thiomicrorhabdus sp. zzn3 TaxID=3039775 RepID=UPI0024369804|nr:YggS family pyridoxal phosphate-dependent enzyme [Thiomicrorhabdus sp. zzn3]MDG6777201.1 YggS family pyridoxal phosphate-dependent enzyme [Thiomicrorhabdus sp. zzn3]